MAYFRACLLIILFLLTFPPKIAGQTPAMPQISFGNLLGTPSPVRNLSVEESKAIRVKKFLEIISENGKKSLAQFEKKSKLPQVSGESKSLSDNIASYLITPVPTLNPYLENILAETTANSNHMGLPNYIEPKSIYTIALLGDSMTDTLGKELIHLRILLKENFPGKQFFLLNYGQGATDIESGLKRLTERTTYLGESYAPLVAYKPDIVVVESFAYNHWGAELSDLNRQWLAIARIIETIRSYSPDTRIILAATISPNAFKFGDGILNWSKDMKWDASVTTKAYLSNLINFATSQNYPLADAYSASLGADSQGLSRYINPVDNLHPSEEGKMLYAHKITETIKLHNLIR